MEDKLYQLLQHEAKLGATIHDPAMDINPLTSDPIKIELMPPDMQPSLKKMASLEVTELSKKIKE